MTLRLVRAGAIEPLMLSDAAPAALADIEIYGAGTALHWERLDVDYELSALMAGVFGTQTWMRELSAAMWCPFALWQRPVERRSHDAWISISSAI
jgi:hypothetical protein